MERVQLKECFLGEFDVIKNGNRSQKDFFLNCFFSLIIVHQRVRA